MVAGCPRTISFSPEKMIELGKEMVEWVKLNDPLHLSQWYTIHKGFTYNEWKSFLQKKEFIPYYEIALKLVGIKYLNGESKKIKDGISQRWQRIYFKDLKEAEDEDADRECERKKSIENNRPSQLNIKVSHDGLGSGINISASEIPDTSHQGP